MSEREQHECGCPMTRCEGCDGVIYHPDGVCRSCADGPDADAGAKTLCAYLGDWRWEQQDNKAKDRWRFIAREVEVAREEDQAQYPLLYDLSIGISYGGAGTPQSV